MTVNDIASVTNMLSPMQSLANMQKINAESESFESLLARLQTEKDEDSEKDDKQLKKACMEFESYFFQIMFREMRKTVFSSGNGIVAKSYAQEIFEDMLDEEYSKQAAKAGGMGIADMMYRQMTRTDIV